MVDTLKMLRFIVVIHHCDVHIEKVSKVFFEDSTQKVIFSNLTYSFKQGRSYALTGISGAGKSTLLHILAGLEKPTSGTIVLGKGTVVANQPENALALIFQIPHFIDELTLVENVMIKGLIAGQRYSDAEKKALDLLKQVGLHEKVADRVRSLSGGEQQRAAVARALFLEPAFLLADEPTAHLDTTTAAEILSLLFTCQKEGGMGLLIASHDQTVAQRCETVLLLSQGTLTVEQPLQPVFHHEVDSLHSNYYGT